MSLKKGVLTNSLLYSITAVDAQSSHLGFEVQFGEVLHTFQAGNLSSGGVPLTVDRELGNLTSKHLWSYVLLSQSPKPQKESVVNTSLCDFYISSFQLMHTWLLTSVQMRLQRLSGTLNYLTVNTETHLLTSPSLQAHFSYKLF